MNSCILHFSLYLWCSVGGYSWVYFSQMDAVFTILCIFIQREPLHRPVFMRVLALPGLESLKFGGLAERRDSFEGGGELC